MALNFQETKFHEIKFREWSNKAHVVFSCGWGYRRGGTHSTCKGMEETAASTSFTMDLCIRGFHIYKDVWEPTEELLTCFREPSNVHDPYAVSMKTRESVIVGHVPRVISSLSNIFIAQGGKLECRVTGHRQYSVDLPQGGLELPCALYFTSSSSQQLEKVKVLFEKCPAHQSVKSNITEPVSKKFKNDEEMESPTYLYVSEISEVWLSYCGYRLTLLDKTKLTDGSMLHDNHINFAQTILKNQFQVAEGLCSSLYQFKQKPADSKIKHGLQIVHY